VEPACNHRPARTGRTAGRASLYPAPWPSPLLWLALAVLAGLVGLAGCRSQEAGEGQQVRAAAEGTQPVAPAASTAPALVGSLATASAVAERGPLVAIIVDDWGQALTGPQAVILALPQPLTLAVLPCLPHSAEIAALATRLDLPVAGADPARAAGGVPPSPVGATARPIPATARREIFLHMPMLPIDYPESDPGEPFLETGLDPAEVERRLARSLATVPGARGVNNHMGSAATADPELMSVFMAGLARRHLLFVDSLTSPASVAYAVARRAGVPALRNRIFLDVDRTSEEAIAGNLAALVAAARAQGSAVGIAHPYIATADVLARELPRYEAEGVRFVTISELMVRTSSAAVGEGGVARGR
jgi:polysaccharide deacetylase 2 family uncharacterized protein YibQ